MSDQKTKLKNLETINKKFFIDELVKFMITINPHKTLTGKQKKDWVLLKLKEELNLPEVAEQLIISFIDLLIEVDKGKIKINKEPLKKVKKGFFCCIG